jgi:peptidoglycan/LPS O-acetylase OafA/YrhL
MKYIKELDGLRAIAVILVIISHWIPADNIINRVPNGLIGVTIFFVISGFLISKNLFESRHLAEDANLTKGTLLKNFFGRRALRIFPIYYLTIGVLYIFSEYTGTTIGSSFLYFATYSSNFYFWKIHTWDGMVSHLWSLAVEEQFYLFWPFIILFVNKRYYFRIILCFILIGVGSRILLARIEMINLLTFTCFDAFGVGALLAWQITYGSGTLKKYYSSLSVAAAVSLTFFVLALLNLQLIKVPLSTLISILTVWLITYFILNPEKGANKLADLFRNNLLVFLGKISYGLYLYHSIVPGLINSKIVNVYLNPLLPDVMYKYHWGQLFLFENAVITVIIAWLSFTLVEKRFLKLKKYFENGGEKTKHQHYLQRGLLAD